MPKGGGGMPPIIPKVSNVINGSPVRDVFDRGCSHGNDIDGKSREVGELYLGSQMAEEILDHP